MVTYVQLRYSRTDGRSWSTGISGMGTHLVAEARSMARNLVKSCDYIEVTIEHRNGAATESSTRYSWSRAKGWH
jgi:hypothetical protein